MFIIAEAGINHNGDIDIAKRLIEAAKASGADVVKFQTYDCELLEPPGNRRELLRKCQLSHEEFRHLKDHADSVGIEFMSTPFDVGSLEFLVSLGVKRLKISSGQCDDRAMIKAASASRLPVIVSCGAGGEYRKVAQQFSTSVTHLTLLHCTSGYPTPVSEIRLSTFRNMVESYEGQYYWGASAFGLSDHTRSVVVPALAVALGATVIEKHIMLKGNCPDAAVSLAPMPFGLMVDAVREAEEAMSWPLEDASSFVMPCENPTMDVIAERKAWRERT